MIPFLAVALLLSGFGLVLANGPLSSRASRNDTLASSTAGVGDATQTTTSTPAAGSTSTSDSGTGTPTAASTPTNEEGIPPIPTPTPTASFNPNTAPFQLLRAEVTSDPGNSFTGTCQDWVVMHFTVTLTVAPMSVGGFVDLGWYPSTAYPSYPNVHNSVAGDGVYFAPGETVHTYRFDEKIVAAYGDGTARSDTLQISGPTPESFTHATYAFTCERHVLSAVLTATSPTTWSAPCTNSPNTIDGYRFNVPVTVTLTPGPATPLTLSYGISPTAFAYGLDVISLTVPGAQDTRTVTGQVTLQHASSNGTYTLKVTGTAPDSFSSNEITVTKSC